MYLQNIAKGLDNSNTIPHSRCGCKDPSKFLEVEEDNDLNNPFMSIPALFNILLVLIKFSKKNAPKATSKDTVNGRIKAITAPIAMYIPIHFS
jgi:hypothetical protein